MIYHSLAHSSLSLSLSSLCVSLGIEGRERPFPERLFSLSVGWCVGGGPPLGSGGREGAIRLIVCHPLPHSLSPFGITFFGLFLPPFWTGYSEPLIVLHAPPLASNVPSDTVFPYIEG